ncbi:MAG: serine/threonine phosphatase [Coleofasciculaceae cyanobacterium]
MLICPQCQFENPNNNKFCQRCGTSLTHKTCHECGTQVPIYAETCHNCSTFTGTVWSAIIAEESNAMSVPYQEASPEAELVDSDIASEFSPQETALPSSVSNCSPVDESASPDATATQVSTTANNEGMADDPVTQPLSSPLRSNKQDKEEQVKVPISLNQERENSSSSRENAVYLDPQQRYLLLEPRRLKEIRAKRTSNPNGLASSWGGSVEVLDCQPLQKSLLEALTTQKYSDSSDPDSSDIPSSPNSSNSWKVLGIPEIARPYLSLQESYYPTMPEVHDAWQHEGEAVVLLENRSNWQLLSELWGNEELSPLQTLYWLDEIALLWEALEPWYCRQSLLEMDNLRVDEDLVLGLVCLYPEIETQQLTLKDLGQMWQALFKQSQRTQIAPLAVVFQKLCDNELTTVQELREHLEDIARSLQTTTSFPAPGDKLEEEGFGNFENLEAGQTNFQNEGDDLPTVILPMQLLSLDDSGCTDIGHQREHNEDYFGIETHLEKRETPLGRVLQARGLYILCDGMGGHDGGEVASAMAVETIKRYFQENWQDKLPNEDSVREAIHLANQTIYEVNQNDARSGSRRMGTTLVMILIEKTNAVIAHVGDSRLYRLTRKRGLELVTVDHEVGQREIIRGVTPKDAYSRPDAYQLTQALGPRSNQYVEPDVQYMELNEDTLFLLCSDGLSDNDLLETHWQTHLAPLLSSRANLDQGMLGLIDLANEHNGHDNITAILVRVKVRPNFEQQRLF